MYAHTPPNFGDLLDRLKVQIERNSMTIKKKCRAKYTLAPSVVSLENTASTKFDLR